MRFVIAGLVVLAAAGRASSAPRETGTLVTGRVSFLGDLPTTDRGYVRLVVRGVAEDIVDGCRTSGRQAFIATYDGELVVDGFNSFIVPVYTTHVTTSSGCPITSLRVDRIDSLSLEGQLGDVAGRGRLPFQTLSVDGDQVLAGAFGNLRGEMVFDSTPVALAP